MSEKINLLMDLGLTNRILSPLTKKIRDHYLKIIKDNKLTNYLSDFSIITKPNGIIALIKDRLVYKENGRKPNSKAPPVSAISKWITKHNIKAHYVYLRELPYVISRSIGKKGISPLNVFKPPTNFLEGIPLGELFRTEVRDNIVNILKR